MLHANTQAQAVLCDIEAFVSVWCTLQMLMFEHRLHKFHESIVYLSMFHVSIFHVRFIDAIHVAVFPKNCFCFASSDLTEVHDARVYVCSMLKHG